jgi:hypothetical protein
LPLAQPQLAANQAGVCDIGGDASERLRLRLTCEIGALQAAQGGRLVWAIVRPVFDLDRQLTATTLQIAQLD